MRKYSLSTEIKSIKPFISSENETVAELGRPQKQG